MLSPDPLIHQALRLQIMATLLADPNAPIGFQSLKVATRATDGNLSSQIATLARAEYVRVLKDYADNRPRTRVQATPAGADAFAAHARYLRDLMGCTP